MGSIRIQATLVTVHGVGVLIRGPAGSGKSWAALRLMDRGHRLVSDDMVEISADPHGALIGLPVDPEVPIEVRGLGIFPAIWLFPEGTQPSASIGLVAELDSYDASRDAGRTGPETSTSNLLGVDLPVVRLPLPAGSDPGLVIEMVVRLWKSRRALIPA
ncbi:MAG: HPr kinase/phosphorylase [Thermodesulfobacteriota bacterium]